MHVYEAYYLSFPQNGKQNALWASEKKQSAHLFRTSLYGTLLCGGFFYWHPQCTSQLCYGLSGFLIKRHFTLTAWTSAIMSLKNNTRLCVQVRFIMQFSHRNRKHDLIASHLCSPFRSILHLSDVSVELWIPNLTMKLKINHDSGTGKWKLPDLQKDPFRHWANDE